jgi:hypothetical protein
MGAIINILFGVWGFLSPSNMAKVVLLDPKGPGGRTEIRSSFGGLWIAIGCFLLFWPSIPAFLFATTIWLGLAVSRMFAASLEGTWNKKTIRILAIEVIVAGMLICPTLKLISTGIVTT